MLSCDVFLEDQELDRLTLQNRLLVSYEQKALNPIVEGRNNLKVLDLGCNEGYKTVNRFSRKEIATVMGLEFHKDLAASAQRKYGDERFSFHHCNIESENFPQRLRRLMREEQIESFDIIYLSFVLMHMKNQQRLLNQIRQFLAPDGYVFIVDADDTASSLMPDPKGLLAGFLEILASDPFAGDRQCAKKIPAMLQNSGYQNITVASTHIDAGCDEIEKKKAIFQVFFSYLPQDVEILQENNDYTSWSMSSATWLAQNYDTLQNLITERKSHVTMGASIITCRGKENECNFSEA